MFRLARADITQLASEQKGCNILSTQLASNSEVRVGDESKVGANQDLNRRHILLATTALAAASTSTANSNNAARAQTGAVAEWAPEYRVFPSRQSRLWRARLLGRRHPADTRRIDAFAGEGMKLLLCSRGTVHPLARRACDRPLRDPLQQSHGGLAERRRRPVVWERTMGDVLIGEGLRHRLRRQVARRRLARPLAHRSRFRRVVTARRVRGTSRTGPKNLGTIPSATASAA